MLRSLIWAYVLLEPGHCRGARGSELPQEGTETAAFDRDKPLAVQCLLVGTQLGIGQGDVVGQGDNHQQRCDHLVAQPWKASANPQPPPVMKMVLPESFMIWSP
jgi:hypothetical protein